MKEFNKLVIPLSIVLAGALIAFAIFMTARKPSTPPSVANAIDQALQPKVDVAPVSDADHIRGNKNAKIIIYDYSDLECPFCKQYHATLQKLFADYGPSNTIAWVYRHFPLDIHPKARKEAEGAECATELGGPDAFWKYVDTIYSITPSNNQLDPQQIYATADKIGLDASAFKTCLDSGKYTAKIEEAYEAGSKAGAQGTPYTVIGVNGEYIPLVDSQGRGLGALPYSAMKSIIDQFANQAK